jgi:hypothetical protein
MARVRLDRDNPDIPFLSQKVKGEAEQLTPNGCAYSYYGEKKNPDRAGGGPAWIGSESEPFNWQGIRSGE